MRYSRRLNGSPIYHAGGLAPGPNGSSNRPLTRTQQRATCRNLTISPSWRTSPRRADVALNAWPSANERSVSRPRPPPLVVRCHTVRRLTDASPSPAALRSSVTAAALALVLSFTGACSDGPSSVGPTDPGGSRSSSDRPGPPEPDACDQR